MIVIKYPATKDDFKAYYALRYHVLREPGGHPKGTEKDDYEPISQHFMAVDAQSGKVLGVARLMEKDAAVAQLSYLAVDEDHRREGIGRMLEKAVEEEARQKNYNILGTLIAQTAREFFEKLDFQMKGMRQNPFGGNIQMIWMEKQL